jgi:two-component system, chemotaxis family, protein-glutamate methylesterase/glutaminase
MSGISKVGAAGAGPVVRVLLVDDSAVARGMEARALQSNPILSVVGSVSNGQMAVDFVGRNPVDVIVLDLEMPVMDGLTAIPKLLEKAPQAKIIVVSALTTSGADISLKCLRAGATDVIAKPSSVGGGGGAAAFAQDLAERVVTLGQPRRPRALAATGAKPLPLASTPAPGLKAAPGDVPTLRRPSSLLPDIIAIGSSTGGPQALFALLGDLKKQGPLRQPIVITQHMPATFTAILANHISSLTGFPASEGKPGDILTSGHVYVAPGDFHMLFERKAAGVSIILSDGPKENFCRPAVDPMFRSLVDIYNGKILAVVLTGMGSDGAKGSAVVADKGGTVIAQDEASSVVWGMPGATARIGACSFILPLDQIASSVARLAGK